MSKKNYSVVNHYGERKLYVKDGRVYERLDGHIPRNVVPISMRKMDNVIKLAEEKRRTGVNADRVNGICKLTPELREMTNARRTDRYAVCEARNGSVFSTSCRYEYPAISPDEMLAQFRARDNSMGIHGANSKYPVIVFLNGDVKIGCRLLSLKHLKRLRTVIKQQRAKK